MDAVLFVDLSRAPGMDSLLGSKMSPSAREYLEGRRVGYHLTTRRFRRHILHCVNARKKDDITVF